MTISGQLTVGTLQTIDSLNAVRSLATGQKAQQIPAATASVLAQLASDAYKPSETTASATQTAGNQPGPETTLDGRTLAQNQVISADLDVRLALLEATSNYTTPTDQAWSSLTHSLAAGDLAGAQTALTAYTQISPTAPESLSRLTAPYAQFLSDLKALGNDLQSGNLATARSDFQTAQYDHPNGVAGAYSTAYDGGNTSAEAVLSEESVVNTAAALTSLGYTPANAKIEANVIEISADAGLTSGSNQPKSPQTNQWITDLARDVASGPELTSSQANSTSGNPFYKIVTTLLTMESASDLDKTLALLASTNATGVSSDARASANSSIASVSAYA